MLSVNQIKAASLWWASLFAGLINAPKVEDECLNSSTKKENILVNQSIFNAIQKKYAIDELKYATILEEIIRKNINLASEELFVNRGRLSLLLGAAAEKANLHQEIKSLAHYLNIKMSFDLTNSIIINQNCYDAATLLNNLTAIKTISLGI